MKKISLPQKLLKPPDLKFIKRLTTQTGIIQHTKFGVPQRSEGYSLDDNARGLIVAVRYFQIYKKKEVLDLAVTYLSFLLAAKRKDGLFYNFQSFDHKFQNRTSEDAFGEVIWALGTTINANARPDLTRAASNLLNEVEGNIEKVKSVRAKAYTVLGLSQLAGGEKYRILLEKLSASMIDQYQKNKEEGWLWFENHLSYANHIVPGALFASFSVTGDQTALQVAQESQDFLEKNTHLNGLPSPIGSFGWYYKGKERAEFDQQCIDPSYAVLCSLQAYKVTKKSDYLNLAETWMAWFFGHNSNRMKLFDEISGGCFDGLTKGGLNLNQGAESVVCFLLAYLELSSIYKSKMSVASK